MLHASLRCSCRPYLRVAVCSACRKPTCLTALYGLTATLSPETSVTSAHFQLYPRLFSQMRPSNKVQGFELCHHCLCGCDHDWGSPGCAYVCFGPARMCYRGRAKVRHTCSRHFACGSLVWDGCGRQGAPALRRAVGSRAFRLGHLGRARDGRGVLCVCD